MSTALHDFAQPEGDHQNSAAVIPKADISCSSKPLHKKQSSADLQSRLKSRKILGVGATDDGLDIHRSKLSQILGANDAVLNANKIPAGIQWWNCFLSVYLTLNAFLSIALPAAYSNMMFGGTQSPSILYSTVTLCLGFPFVAMTQAYEKTVQQWLLLSAEIFLFVHGAGAFYGGVLKALILLTLLFLTNTWYMLTLSSDTAAVFEILRKFFSNSRNSFEDSYNNMTTSYQSSSPSKKME